MSQNSHSLSSSDSDSEKSAEAHILLSTKNGSSSQFSAPIGKLKSPRKRRAVSKADKVDKAAEKKKLDRILPATCLNFIKVCVSESLTEHHTFSSMQLALMHKSFILKTVQSEHDSIFWMRLSETDVYVEESYLLILWDHVKFLKYIEHLTVQSYFSRLKDSKPGYKIFFVVFGLKDYCRRLKRKSNLTVEEMSLKVSPSKDMVEDLLCELSLKFGVVSRLIDDPMQLHLLITQATKSIGEALYRKRKESDEAEKKLYIFGDNKSCVKVDKQNFGMKRLWQQQLAELPKSSLDIAKAVTSQYPTPFKLFEKYNSVYFKDSHEKVLQDLVVGRNGSKKRIGPEMSKKIGLLFSSENSS